MNHRPRRPPSLLGELQDYGGAFDRAFSMVAFTMNRFIVDHFLRAGRQLTDNDFEALLLWGVLAHQNVAHLLPPGSVPCAVLDERGRLPDETQDFRPLRQRDIVQISGMPRETVRRKLISLQRLGLIERTAKGWIVSRDPVESKLRDFTRDSARRFLMAADDVMRALREADLPRPLPEAMVHASAAPATGFGHGSGNGGAGPNWAESPVGPTPADPLRS